MVRKTLQNGCTFYFVNINCYVKLISTLVLLNRKIFFYFFLVENFFLISLMSNTLTFVQ
jgi:hypothetical protein